MANPESFPPATPVKTQPENKCALSYSRILAIPPTERRAISRVMAIKFPDGTIDTVEGRVEGSIA